jgi:hypothetical protein
MSAIASAVERTRNAFASLAKLEAAVALAPADRGLQLNLMGCRKTALQYERDLFSFTGHAKKELCRYRLIPEATDGFALDSVANSIGSYQKLFSQIYDAKKHGGTRVNVGFGVDSGRESTLEIGYTYSGSLGIVLLGPSGAQSDLLGGAITSSIEALYRVLDVKSQTDVRAIAKEFGLAVVKRLHAWTNANQKAGFAADVRWTLADGKERGEVVDSERMSKIVGLIDATTDETSQSVAIRGRLVGIDMKTRTFHLLGPKAVSLRGTLAEDFPVEDKISVNRYYECSLIETCVVKYAAEKIDRSYTLKRLVRVRADKVSNASQG